MKDVSFSKYHEFLEVPNIKNIADEAMIGVTSAIRERKLKMLDLMNHAIYGITEGVRSYGNDARVAAQMAAEKSLKSVREAEEKYGD